MRGISKLSIFALVAMLLLSTLFIVVPIYAAPTTTIELVNPIDGTHNFHFTTSDISYGQTFTINIKINNVTDLMTWQAGISWDPTLLEFAEVVWPTSGNGFIFAEEPKYTVGPTVSPGYVVLGVICNTAGGGHTFTGSGTAAQIKLKVIKEVSMLFPSVECPLDFANIGVDTFLLNGSGGDITFDTIGGHYQYTWVAPTLKPRFYIKPSTIKPSKIGDPVDVEIWVADVDANWQIISFQFSIMWNTSCLAPRDPYWSRGTFIETFSYFTPPEDGVLYAADINVHYRPPPWHEIPADYNFSSVAVFLLPDPATNNTFHPPFPSREGKLATLHFTAICETLSPLEYWTKIEFVAEDILALNVFGLDIGFNRADPANYRCPQKILGLAIDLYTQYDAPYGGQGPNMPSDMFAPQQQVELYAKVTYNEYPVQQKLVGFEIRHGDYVFWREATTDADGVAHVSFRIPWPCENPEDEIFGKWYVTATVEVAEQKKNDTLGFWVWWLVEVLSIEPKQTEYIQRKTGGDPLTFTVEYRTFSMQTLDAIITATIYDELGFFIGSDYKSTTVGWGEYKYYNYTACEEPPELGYTWDVTITMPTNAVVGKGAAFANAFDEFPWLGGTPYCPEVRNTIDFYIAKP
jgi:hypothetical protein